jgi:O-antigen/teichoic acid export membrane protein
MKKRIRTALFQNRILIENFSFLSILQISNLIVFIIIVPYLFRVLGENNYGLVVFAQTIAIYFSILVNFGFNITATRDISVNKSNFAKVSSVISNVLFLKFGLFVLSMVLLAILSLFIPVIRINPALFYFSMLFCLGEALFPVWYFQGIEQMKYITYINVFSRGIAALMVYLIVNKPEHFYYVPLILGMGSIIGALAGLFIVFGFHKNSFKITSTSDLKNTFLSNLPLFLSNISSQLYVNSNKLIIGFSLGMQQVAIYDLADKIYNLLKVPVYLIAQTLFPKVSRELNVKFVLKTMKICIFFVIIIYFFLFFFSESIIHLLTGAFNHEAAEVLRILSFSIIPVCMGLFFAELILLPFGQIKAYSAMRYQTLFVYIFLIAILFTFNILTLKSISTIIILVEGFVLIKSYLLCKKHKIISNYLSIKQ